jgi:hypothetical protein
MRHKPSIFLSHNAADKPFVRRLAGHLTPAGAAVWIDDAEIKVGDSLIEKIETGLIKSDYLGVVLSPNSVASNWVRTELRAVLNQEIREASVRVLPILYQDCDIPFFLRDKLYADFRSGSFRKALAQLLAAMGLKYHPVGRLPRESAFDPIREAEVRITSISDEVRRSQYATALYLSITTHTITGRPELPIPDLITAEYDISLEQQFRYRISLTRSDSYKYLRDMGRVLASFMESGLGRRYHQRFKRDPSTVWSGPDHYMFSYCELLEWFDIPEDVQFPSSLQDYVNYDRLPLT